MNVDIIPHRTRFGDNFNWVYSYILGVSKSIKNQFQIILYESLQAKKIIVAPLGGKQYSTIILCQSFGEAHKELINLFVSASTTLSGGI